MAFGSLQFRNRNTHSIMDTNDVQQTDMEVKSLLSNVCYWDKHPFSGTGIQCPIKYKPKQIVHKKKEYYINENVPRDTDSMNEQSTNAEILYTDMFCSMRCLVAWIRDNHLNPEYKQSYHILANEYMRTANKVLPSPANNWRLLASFGGFMTIDEFRSNESIYVVSTSRFDEGQKVCVYKEMINIK